MQIDVIVPTFDNPQALDKVLLGFDAQQPHFRRLIIANDGSGPATSAVIERWRRAWGPRLIEVHQEHLGFRKCRILNEAIARSTADYLVFCDGDCVPEAHFLADHRALAERGYWVQGKRAQIHEPAVPGFDPRDIAMHRLLRQRAIWRAYYGVRWPVAVVWHQRHGRLRERAMGSNMGIWREDLLAINGYNEGFEGWGDEDREVTVRLHNLGRRKKFVIGRALQFHLDHPPASRARTGDNGDLLAEVRASGRVRCELGLSAHLGASATGA